MSNRFRMRYEGKGYRFERIHETDSEKTPTGDSNVAKDNAPL